MQNPLHYSLKLYPSPEDSRDHVVKATAPLKVAGFVDLSADNTSVKDQGILGSCTAFASVAAMEFLHKKFGGSKVNDLFSERFTYYATRVNVMGWAPSDSGAYVRDAVKSLVKYGTCLEKTCAYNNDCTTAPSPQAYAEALQYQALSYARFDEGTNINNRQQLIGAIKANFDAGLPIVCGITCYSNIWSAVKGVIPKGNGQVIGGHAILLVGYDDSKQLFKFKNSWGSKWGDNGYGYLPYEYYLKGDMFDLWTIYKSELQDIKSVGLDIVKPSVKNPDKDAVIAALNSVISKVDDVLDKKKSIAVMTDLIYSCKNPKVAVLLNNLKSALYNIAV
jgi:hypothetical protein